MTKDEALKLALEALKQIDEAMPFPVAKLAQKVIKEALAQPEQDNTYTYASSLAKTIWQKHYIKESPKFALLDTTEGVLTQIDNMTCGLVREKPAQPEQEPVGEIVDAIEGAFKCSFTKMLPVGTKLYTTPPQRKPLSDEEIETYRHMIDWTAEWSYINFARAIEAAHGIKGEA